MSLATLLRKHNGERWGIWEQKLEEHKPESQLGSYFKLSNKPWWESESYDLVHILNVEPK